MTPAEKRMSEEMAQAIVKEFNQLSGNRGNWESHWKEIAERVWPSHSQLFTSRGTGLTEGERRTQELYDSTAAVALGRFGAILDSLLTPRNQTWHRLQASDPALMKDHEVATWFEDLNRALFRYRYAPKANFASQNQLIYKSLGAYGSGCMWIDKLRLPTGEKGLRYKSMHLSRVYFKENHQGIVDHVLRYFELTARQAMQEKEWLPNMPAQVVEAAKTDPDRKFEFLHCVKPRTDYDPQRADHKGKLYGSYWVAMCDPRILHEGGFETFPYAISRYEQAPEEVYGRSPFMDALPAIKTLNEMKKTVLKQGHRTVDPVLLAHDDGIMDGFNLRPGAVNYGGVSADGRPLVHTLPVGRVDIGKDLMDDERAVINDAALVTLFQILIESPQMTATEVMERTREKGILIAPTIGRQQSEYLGPTIEREIDLMSQLGLVPPLPQALVEANGEYRIEYESPLSRAARAEEAAGAMRTVEMAINVAAQTQNPEPLDHFDWDQIIPEIAEIHGMPAKWRRSLEKIQEIREGRAEAVQQDREVQAAPSAAAMVKSIATAKKAAATGK